MITCSQCYHQEMVGALFCNQCGAPIQNARGPSTPPSAFPRESMGPAPDLSFPLPPELYPDPGSSLALRLVDFDKVIPVASHKETTLGRVSDGQPVIPDLDLSPYQAYEAGVSRLHASLRITEGEVMILDLGSANGTRLNGQKITPHHPQPIHHGDMITLGKFRIQILVGSVEK